MIIFDWIVVKRQYLCILIDNEHNMETLEQTYFYCHADEILKSAGLTKAQFAAKMNIKPQNVNKLLGTNNVHTLTKIADLLGVSLPYVLHGPTISETLNGFVEYNNTIYKIKNKEDLKALLAKIE